MESPPRQDPETAKAIGLAAATMAANLVAVVFTVIFTRLLGADGYGALAAIISGFLILMVGGQSIQVAAAREATLGHLGTGGDARLPALLGLGLLSAGVALRAHARRPN